MADAARIGAKLLIPSKLLGDIRDEDVQIATTPKLDFGRLCCVAGDVYQAVECAGGHFNNILNSTRCLEMVSGP